MATPIDNLKPRYDSCRDHLKAIQDAVIEQFKLPEDARPQIVKAISIAYEVGRNTTTTDDWCDSF